MKTNDILILANNIFANNKKNDQDNKDINKRYIYHLYILTRNFF